MADHEKTIRDAYAAFNRGDLDGFLAACTDDFTFHVPGSSKMAGDYRGRDGMTELVGKVMEISAGSFKEDVHDVVVNDEHGIVLANHSLDRGGKQHAYNTVHVYHYRDDKLAEAWECPADPVTFDAAWA